MIPKSKTDPNLGELVHNYLIEKGVETPVVFGRIREQKESKKEIERLFREIMIQLNLDLRDDSLQDSPTRVSKMYVDEIFYGLDYDNFPKCTVVDNKIKHSSMVIEYGIKSISTCEHHFVTIDGKCSIAYIPKDKVLGLSKLNRIVDFFSRRPQIQERLTMQIYHALSFVLGTEDIGVVIDATHYCVKSRGVEDSGSGTITSHMGGVFFDNLACRQEFLSFISNAKK